MLTYLTAKGLTDAQIQLISGHESKKSLEVYRHLSLESVDKAYEDAVQTVGIRWSTYRQSQSRFKICSLTALIVTSLRR
jgi:hypothetical protein